MAFLLSELNVVDYLTDAGVWPIGQVCVKLEPKPGKNFNVRVAAAGSNVAQVARSSECDFLVKQEPHSPDVGALGELSREWRFYQLLRSVPSLTALRSRFEGSNLHTAALPLHFDEENAIIVFPYLPDVIDLSAFYNKFESPYPVAIAAAMGETFAQLHSDTFQSQPCEAFWRRTQEAARSDIPDFLLGLRRLTPETFCVVSADALKFFRFYQRYPEMGTAIAQLNRSFTPCCIVHDDPRFANFLLREAEYFSEAMADDWSDEMLSDRVTVQLIDWEKWKWGDPAYDLGKTIANYLRLWLESIPISANLDISTALSMAAVPLDAMQGNTSALVRSYLAHFPKILVHQPDFVVRITQFAGLGLLRQVQLWIAHKSPIGNVEMAMTQVAKSLLCQPQMAITTVFGQEQAQLESAAGLSQSFQAVR